MKKEISIETSRGVLKARTCAESDYPGIKLYLGDELMASLEVYEHEGLLRLISYNETDDEPIAINTLINFNDSVIDTNE